MRLALVTILLAASLALAGGRGGDDCLARCSDRMNDCTKSCKNGPCIQRCGDGMQKCSGNCAAPSSATPTKVQPPRPKQGHVPKPQVE